jgi:hypothetical protein
MSQRMLRAAIARRRFREATKSYLEKPFGGGGRFDVLMEPLWGTSTVLLDANDALPDDDERLVDDALLTRNATGSPPLTPSEPPPGCTHDKFSPS